MGRLPSTYANREIRNRNPYAMPGELIMAASVTGTTFPEATFLNATNMPFEIHRLIPRVVATLDSLPLATQPDQELLAALVRIKVFNLTMNQNYAKAAARINTLTKGSAERTWEFADPDYLPNGHQYQIQVDTLAFPAGGAFTALIVCITLEGFMLEIAPPSEAR